MQTCWLKETQFRDFDGTLLGKLRETTKSNDMALQEMTAPDRASAITGLQSDRARRRRSWTVAPEFTE